MHQTTEIEVRRLSAAEIRPDLLDDFAHCQQITQKWVMQNGDWTLTDVSLLRAWNAEKRVWVASYMRQQISRGGVTLGACFHDRLTGFCCVDGALSGRTARYANLTMLFVDDRWQRNGIGRSLFHEACACALSMGAEKLFISAIPSAETIAFYQSMGCVDADEIIEAFVDSEDDRYLTFSLVPPQP